MIRRRQMIRNAAFFRGTVKLETRKISTRNSVAKTSIILLQIACDALEASAKVPIATAGGATKDDIDDLSMMADDGAGMTMLADD